MLFFWCAAFIATNSNANEQLISDNVHVHTLATNQVDMNSNAVVDKIQVNTSDSSGTINLDYDPNVVVIDSVQVTADSAGNLQQIDKKPRIDIDKIEIEENGVSNVIEFNYDKKKVVIDKIEVEKNFFDDDQKKTKAGIQTANTFFKYEFNENMWNIMTLPTTDDERITVAMRLIEAAKVLLGPKEWKNALAQNV